MTQVVSNQQFTPESSTKLTRPHFNAFLSPDTNIGDTNITEYKKMQDYNHLHIPARTTSPEYDVDCCDEKFNNTEAMPISVKKRTDLRIIDPITGFISPAGEVLTQKTKHGLPSFGKSRIEPQTTIPSNTHSIRTNKEAIDELKRVREGESEPELRWDSLKVSDTVLKSRLGGWTSDKDPRGGNQIQPSSPYGLRDIFPHMKLCYKDEQERDALAKNYQFTTSTQEMYGQVNWDKKVPKKLHAPVTTYERKADPLKPDPNPYSRPQIWQTIAGVAWDRTQDRYSNMSREEVVFTAPTKRGNHLPGYSGHIGGRNMEYKDDVFEKFVPFTVLRTQQPKEPDANYKPNIPGYTGHTHHFKTKSVSHYDAQGRPYTTTAAFHRQMPVVNQNHPQIPSLSGDFARIQSKVPPQNPYDTVKRITDPGVNNSIDHVTHPTVVPKHPNHEDYLIVKRAERLASMKN